MNTAVDAIKKAARHRFDLIVDDEDEWIAIPGSVAHWSGTRIPSSDISALLFQLSRSTATSFLNGELSPKEVEYVAVWVMEKANQKYWKHNRLRRRGTQRGGWQ